MHTEKEIPQEDTAMDLLVKFEAVEIKAEHRISEDDRAFCEAHQNAYNDAKTSLLELSIMWSDILDGQKAALKGTGNSSETYVSAGYITSLSQSKIREQINKLHPTFVSSIVRHFRDKYHINLSEEAIRHKLIPREPAWKYGPEYDREIEEHQEKMQALSLDYQEIVDLIFAQTGGRDLWEFAVHQLKERCRSAVWYYGKCRYERKTYTVQISSMVYGCYDLCESAKDVLRGLAHFETEKVGIIPREFSEFFSYSGPSDSSYDLEDCQKICKIKLFKNGRMDIRFSQEAYAVQFIEGYLGTSQ